MIAQETHQESFLNALEGALMEKQQLERSRLNENHQEFKEKKKKKKRNYLKCRVSPQIRDPWHLTKACQSHMESLQEENQLQVSKWEGPAVGLKKLSKFFVLSNESNTSVNHLF